MLQFHLNFYIQNSKCLTCLSFSKVSCLFYRSNSIIWSLYTILASGMLNYVKKSIFRDWYYEIKNIYLCEIYNPLFISNGMSSSKSKLANVVCRVEIIFNTSHGGRGGVSVENCYFGRQIYSLKIGSGGTFLIYAAMVLFL